MIPGSILMPVAYLPPIDFFCLVNNSEDFLIESCENYIKQTYRNRCYILSAHGRQLLTVPVLEGSRHKIPITDVAIDYSKRWQQVHLGAIRASYRMAPYYQFYSGEIESVIDKGYKYLWELNIELIKTMLRLLKISKEVRFTADFEHPSDGSGDFRYRLHPDKQSLFPPQRYFQVFNTAEGFLPNLSIIDLLFNQGPDSARFL